MPLFEKEPNGQAAKSKYIMGRRNWCAVWWDINGDLVFDVRVEIEKGVGRTARLVSRSLVFPPLCLSQPTAMLCELHHLDGHLRKQ